MDNEEAAKFLVGARELRELASTIKPERHRKLPLDSAEKSENLAKLAHGLQRKR